MPIPIDERKKLTEVKVHVSTGKGVEIYWCDVRHCCDDERGCVIPFFLEITEKGIDDIAVFLQDSPRPRPSAAQR
jgi:hypothetical protein